jgi:lipid II:glycine glycyltransferase (peptidoglycan interpeptide bridge formation enzyme)
MQAVQFLDECLWRDFVSDHPRGNLFHTPEMFQVFTQAKGYRPEIWATVDGHSGILALLLPVHITLVGGLLSGLTTRSVVHGSILCQAGPRGQEALGQLLEAYGKSVSGRSLFTELRNHYDLDGLQSLLQSYGYAYEEHLNYLIELNRPPEEILQSISPKTRNRIRRGLREKQVEISEVTNRGEMAQWHATLKRTYEEAHVPLADYSLFEAAFDILYPKGRVKFLLAQVHGVTAACSMLLLYKDSIYAWYGGTDRAHSQHRPNDMLNWHILEWGANHGYRQYDFGGAGKPDEEYGVRDYKGKFHGELVCFGRNTCVHAPWRLALARWGYKLFRNTLVASGLP